MEKNTKKRGKNEIFWDRFGEMERNTRSATCEHNYGARFFEWRCPGDHVIQC